jgi:acyl-CoA synthetase (AMP-forming)/AMP-acid ligase II
LGDLGLGKGDRVAILSRNRTEYVEAYCVSKAGMVGMPLNWRLALPELSYLLQNSEAKVILADEFHTPVADALAQQSPQLAHRISLDGPRPGWLDYQDLLDSASNAEPTVEVDPKEPLSLFYTSGTTGLPKGVNLTHQGLLRNAGEVAELGLELTPQDVTVSVMPLFHVGGMWYHLFPSYLSGCTTVLDDDPRPDNILKLLMEHKANNIHLVPTMIASLINLPGVADASLDHLRWMYYAASNIPEQVLRQALRVFSKAGFLQSYGSTEAGVCTALIPDDHRLALSDPKREDLLNSCGRPFGSTDLMVLDPQGAEVPLGEIGEVTVKSPKLMGGYWRNPSADRDALQDGWLRTGDLARRDEEGYVYIVGRKHDMIVTGGENVYPHEVENALYHNPDVAEAAVIGLPHPKWVEQVAAIVVLKDGHSVGADQILSNCRQQLAGYKCPKEIFFAESLPKNPAGKILKRKLREQYGLE